MRIYGTANGCRGCGEQFGTLQQFDRHQGVDYSRPFPVLCAAPEALGLVRDGHGVWQTPEGLLARQRCAERLHAMRVEKT